jgi:cytochrome o ubiquinol oxidase subunit 2
MAGMTSQVSLQADQAGAYLGFSAQFSGRGFSDMRFAVRAEPPDTYAKWVEDARKAGPALDRAAYAALAEPGANAAPVLYRSVDPRLFDAIVHEKADAPGFSSLCGGRKAPASSRKGS